MVDERWADDMWSTCRCAAAFLATLFALDAWAGTLNLARTALWGSLGLLFFLLLVPSRVAAGPGWLTSRALIREKAVRTDRLVCLRWTQDSAQRLILQDADGGRVEVDPEVLIANPTLWSLVLAGVRVSLERGPLSNGESVVRELTRRIEAQTALAILQASGLCENERV